MFLNANDIIWCGKVLLLIFDFSYTQLLQSIITSPCHATCGTACLTVHFRYCRARSREVRSDLGHNTCTDSLDAWQRMCSPQWSISKWSCADLPVSRCVFFPFLTHDRTRLYVWRHCPPCLPTTTHFVRRVAAVIGRSSQQQLHTWLSEPSLTRCCFVYGSVVDHALLFSSFLFVCFKIRNH